MDLFDLAIIITEDIGKLVVMIIVYGTLALIALLFICLIWGLML